MVNAKDELLKHIQDKKKVRCAIIDLKTIVIYLKVGFKKHAWNDFLKVLDFVYKEGYGTQVIDGVIWYVDGAWSERGEYDGAEWWDYKSIPEIPKELTKLKKMLTIC